MERFAEGPLAKALPEGRVDVLSPCGGAEGSAVRSSTTSTDDDDTFSTTSAPLTLHSALDYLLRPEALLAEVLAYAGPAGVSKLRTFPLLRRRISRLNVGDLVRAGLLFGGGGDCGRDECFLTNRFAMGTPPEEAVNALRARLLERDPATGSPRPAAKTTDGRVMLRGRPDWRDHRLTVLGMLALAQYSLASERCLRNIVHRLGDGRTRRSGGEYPAVRYASIAQAIAENPASSASVLGSLYDWDRHRAREAGNSRGPTLVSYDDTVVHSIAENDNASPRLLRRLADNPSGAVRAAVAGNARTSGDVLATLAGREEPGLVLMAVGRNPRTPERALVALSVSDRAEAREAVAGNPRTPAIALQALASNDDVQVRMALSCNDGLPADVLADLGRDKHWPVRRNVAQHPRADPATLRALLRDESRWVRLAAAWNSNLPAEEVASSLDADDPSDRSIVAGTSRDPALLDRLARDSNSGETVLRDIAGNAFASEDTLAFLCGSADVRVRVIVALNPRTPSSLLRDALLHDRDPHVRAVAVRNPNTDPRCLLRLATAPPHEQDEEMVEALANDDKVTGECLSAVFRRIEATADPSSRYRLMECLALNPRTPPSVLSALSTSESVEVRSCVAPHHGLSLHSLAKMSGSRFHAVLFGVSRNALIQSVADHLSCLITV